MILVIVFIGAFEFSIVSLIPIGAELVPGLPGRGLGLLMAAATIGRAITTIPTTWLYDNVGIAGSATLAAAWAAIAGVTMAIRRAPDGSAAVAVGDRQAAVAAERLRRHPDTRRALAALVLGDVDEPGDAAHDRRRGRLR